MTKALGVDCGTKRVGVSISDSSGIIARPLDVLPRSEFLDRLEELIAENEIELVVVGLPMPLSGRESSSTQDARALASEIEGLGVEVVLADERFTSRIAESTMLEAGVKRRSRREKIDKIAATIILQSYLDSQRSRGNPTDPQVVQHTDSHDH